MIPDAYAVIDQDGAIVYTVAVSKSAPYESNDWAQDMCHEHINDEIAGDVEGAGRWVVRALTIGVPPCSTACVSDTVDALTLYAKRLDHIDHELAAPVMSALKAVEGRLLIRAAASARVA